MIVEYLTCKLSNDYMHFLKITKDYTIKKHIYKEKA